MFSNENIKKVDPAIAEVLDKELERQNSHIELIASENWVNDAILEAAGSILTNKYAEGYPGKRYYGGCEVVDEAERLAIERVKELYGCEYANVQPHSGSQANFAAFFAILKPGDTYMGMNLNHGGHLTHGNPINYSGSIYHPVPYGVDENGFIDYDEVLKIAKECKPKLILAGASAYARKIDFKKFREICDEVGAVLMVDMGPRGGLILSNAAANEKFNFNRAVFPGSQGGPLLHIIAAKAIAFKQALEPEFKEYQKQVLKNAQALAKGLMNRGIKLVSNGTDNHLMLVDLRDYDMSGKELEKALDSVRITCNKNTIPNDPRSPFVTSGIRLGTPAITTRGFKEEEMDLIAEAIAEVIKNGEEGKEKALKIVEELTKKIPLK